MLIEVSDVRDADVLALLAFHLQDLAGLSPAESQHALDVEALRQANITFWTARINHQLAGCVALKALNETHAELKSMRTAPAFLRQGVAAGLLEFVLGEAKQRGFLRVSLETGSAVAFEPARRLYTRFGFVECAPFGGYVADVNNVFMTRCL